MTIIAVQASAMAADSASFQSDVMFPAPEPKIIRSPDGGLIGATGATGDCQILRRWVASGMDFAKPPRFSFVDPASRDSVLWLWLKPDLTVRMGDCFLNHWLVPSPVAVGTGTEFFYGALDGGCDLTEAVTRTIARVPYLGGKVQVERIPLPERPAYLAVEVRHGETFQEAADRARKESGWMAP